MGSAPAPSTPASAAPLALGAAGPVSITLDEQLPAGPWDAMITVKSGLVERTAQATITFPDTGSAAPVATTAEGTERSRLMPAAIGLLVLLAIAAFLVMGARRRRRPGPDIDDAIEGDGNGDHAEPERREPVLTR